jgi:hypothetical protein
MGIKQEHAAGTCSIDMKNGHASWTCIMETKTFSIDKQQGQTAWTCFKKVLMLLKKFFNMWKRT